MTLDPHAGVQPAPDHAQTPDGGWVHHPGCFWCQEGTAQPPPGTAQGAGS
jgi:hypothetical protein